MREKTGDKSHIADTIHEDNETAFKRGLARGLSAERAFNDAARFAALASTATARGADETTAWLLYSLSTRLTEMLGELSGDRRDLAIFSIGSALEEIRDYVEFRAAGDMMAVDKAGFDYAELREMTPSERWKRVQQARAELAKEAEQDGGDQ